MYKLISFTKRWWVLLCLALIGLASFIPRLDLAVSKLFLAGFPTYICGQTLEDWLLGFV